MNEHDLYRAMSHVGDDLIAESAHRPARKPRFAQWRALAACLALVLLCGAAVGGYAAVYEANEYRVAIAFFEEYNLPADGLSREEIKAVYQDIEAQSFTHPLTLRLLNTLSATLSGSAIAATDSDSLRAFWNHLREASGQTNPHTTALAEAPLPPTYRYELSLYSPESHETSTGVSMILQAWTIRCYRDDTLLWQQQMSPLFTCSSTNAFLTPDDGVLLYGSMIHGTLSSIEQTRACAIRISATGEILWTYTSDYPSSRFDIGMVDKDSFALFGHTESESYETLFTYLAPDGTLRHSQTTLLSAQDDYQSVIPLDNGYLLRSQDNRLVFVGADGYAYDETDRNVTRLLHDGDRNYWVADMICHGDQIWVSAERTITTKDVNALTEVSTFEVNYYAEWSKLGYRPSVPEDELAAYTADMHTLFESVLFIYEADGTLRRAYTAIGSRTQGMLEKDTSGQILWRVDRMDRATPADRYMNVRCILANITEVLMTFDSHGRITAMAETEVETMQQWIY